MNLISLLLSSVISWGALPPARMILERTAENAGSGSYAIEQEVQIPNGLEPLILRENWVVENGSSMKVTVTGPREFPNLRFQILYAGGQRWTLRDGKRESSGIPSDFAEKFFHWRTLEVASQHLTSLRLIPHNLLQRKAPPRRVDDYKYEPEEGVRLSRTSGVIAWAFGLPSASSSADKSPGLWVEQDQFLIRKVRLPSQAEITADNYTGYARGLQLPKVRNIQWGTHNITIRVLSVAGRGASALSTGALDTQWKMQGLEGQPAREAIEEFYKRFR